MRKIKNNIVKVLRDPDTNLAQKKQQQKQQKYLDLHQQSIYIRHKQFLNQYKSTHEEIVSPRNQKQLQALKISKIIEEKKESELQQSDVNEHTHNISCIQDRMNMIHQKIQNEVINSSRKQSKNSFKIFTTNVTHKNDIERINKQRRFINSLSNKKIQYEEPKMTNVKYLPMELRNIHKIFDEKKLMKQAKQFTQKVQKEKQKLWGLHLINKKKEQEKRQQEQKLEKQRIKMRRQMRLLQKYKIPQEDNPFTLSRVLQRSKTEQTYKLNEAIKLQSLKGHQIKHEMRQTNQFLDSSYLANHSVTKQHSQPLEKMMQSNESDEESAADHEKIDFKVKKHRRYTTISRNKEQQPESSNLNKINISLSPIKGEKSHQNSNFNEKKTEKKNGRYRFHKNSMETDLQTPQRDFQIKKSTKQTNSESNY